MKPDPKHAHDHSHTHHKPPSAPQPTKEEAIAISAKNDAARRANPEPVADGNIFFQREENGDVRISIGPKGLPRLVHIVPMAIWTNGVAGVSALGARDFRESAALVCFRSHFFSTLNPLTQWWMR